MSDSNQVYDYMAAAEESIKQMDLMVRQVPGYIKATLADEYRRSPWATEIPKKMERLESLIMEEQKSNRETQQSNRQLRQMYWLTIGVLFLICGAFLVLTLLIT